MVDEKFTKDSDIPVTFKGKQVGILRALKSKATGEILMLSIDDLWFEDIIKLIKESKKNEDD